MTTAAQEFIYVQYERETAARTAPPPLHDLVSEARDHETEIAERVSASKACHDKCELLVRQLDQGIASDLYVELDTDLASALRQLAASVRIKYKLVARQLEEAHKLADECDEASALHDAAEQLKDRDEQEEQAGRVLARVEQLRTIDRYNLVLYRMLYEQHRKALELFDSLRR